MTSKDEAWANFQASLDSLRFEPYVDPETECARAERVREQVRAYAQAAVDAFKADGEELGPHADECPACEVQAAILVAFPQAEGEKPGDREPIPGD